MTGVQTCALPIFHVVACGSALHAGLVGKAAIEKLARVPVLAQVASEFRYSDPIIGPDDLCIIISQSGETADTLAALREAKKRGARTVAICNVVSSSAAREADSVLYTWAGPEIAVATTKAYSAQLAALYLIAVRAALARGTMDQETARRYCEEILALPGKIVHPGGGPGAEEGRQGHPVPSLAYYPQFHIRLRQRLFPGQLLPPGVP